MSSKKPAPDTRDGALVIEKCVGQGGFGSVWKATWEGAPVAVKVMALPSTMSGEEKQSRMALMEAAISGCLAHPNIVQTFTCDVRENPLAKGRQRDAETKAGKPWMPWADFTAQARTAMANYPPGASPHRLEIRLVMEYCDGGSLRDALRDRR